MRRHRIGVSRTWGANLEDHDNKPQGSDKRHEVGDFSAAMNRLEKAVQELVSVTTGEITGRAASLIEETSKRLEAELRLKKVADTHPEAERAYQRRRHSNRIRHVFNDIRRGERLYIDPSEGKIAGVCAAFARYFGVDTWWVRMGALTGLVFVPGVVFPAYWIAYFVIEKKEKGRGKHKHRRRYWKRTETVGARAESAPEQDPNQPGPTTFVPPFNAGQNLRHITTDMTQAELRLRRLEAFVTSDRYELQKELTRIEREDSIKQEDSV